MNIYSMIINSFVKGKMDQYDFFFSFLLNLEWKVTGTPEGNKFKANMATLPTHRSHHWLQWDVVVFLLLSRLVWVSGFPVSLVGVSPSIPVPAAWPWPRSAVTSVPSAVPVSWPVPVSVPVSVSWSVSVSFLGTTARPMPAPGSFFPRIETRNHLIERECETRRYMFYLYPSPYVPTGLEKTRDHWPWSQNDFELQKDFGGGKK